MLPDLLRKDYSIGTPRYNWPMSVHASQAFSMSSVPIVLSCPSSLRLVHEMVPDLLLP